MIQHHDRFWTPRLPITLLLAAGILGTLSIPTVKAQDKPKADGPAQKKVDAKDPKKADAKDQKKTDAKDQKKADAKDQKKADAKPQPADEKEGRGQAAPAAGAAAPADDPAKLKAQVAALEKEVAALKLKVATLELEKLGAMVSVDKAKDGKETATVNILKKWSGDKDAFQLLKNVPNLQVVYIDNGQVNDAAVGAAQGPDGLERADAR